MAIISASRRTDIPAFYPAWFMDKIQRGSVLVKNPFNGRIRQVSLLLEDVEGIVFWSRNYAPMQDNLARLAGLGYGFYLQFTIIGYPKWLDPGSPSITLAVRTAHTLAKAFGPQAVVWRYDPILLAGGMDAAWHLENFKQLAAMMEGATNECVTSFVDFYAKFSRSLPESLEKNHNPLSHPARGELAGLLEAMGAIAGERGVRLSACCEPEDIRGRTAPATCVDKARMEAIIKKGLPGIPRRPTRELCSCHLSVDVGAYGSCPAACAYCYATGSRESAAAKLAAIKPQDPGLWPTSVVGV